MEDGANVCVLLKMSDLYPDSKYQLVNTDIFLVDNMRMDGKKFAFEIEPPGNSLKFRYSEKAIKKWPSFHFFDIT